MYFYDINYVMPYIFIKFCSKMHHLWLWPKSLYAIDRAVRESRNQGQLLSSRSLQWKSKLSFIWDTIYNSKWMIHSFGNTARALKRWITLEKLTSWNLSFLICKMEIIMLFDSLMGITWVNTCKMLQEEPRGMTSAQLNRHSFYPIRVQLHWKRVEQFHL